MPSVAKGNIFIYILKSAYLVRYVFFTAALMKPLPITGWNRPQPHFLGIHYVSHFSQASCWDVFQFWDSFRILSYRPHWSDNFCYSILNLFSQSRFWYPALSCMCHISSRLVFFSWSPLSVSSQTLDRTWLNAITAYIKLTPQTVLHTAVYLYPSGTPQQSDLAV